MYILLYLGIEVGELAVPGDRTIARPGSATVDAHKVAVGVPKAGPAGSRLGCSERPANSITVLQP